MPRYKVDNATGEQYQGSVQIPLATDTTPGVSIRENASRVDPNSVDAGPLGSTRAFPSFKPITSLSTVIPYTGNADAVYGGSGAQSFASEWGTANYATVSYARATRGETWTAANTVRLDGSSVPGAVVIQTSANNLGTETQFGERALSNAGGSLTDTAIWLNMPCDSNGSVAVNALMSFAFGETSGGAFDANNCYLFQKRCQNGVWTLIVFSVVGGVSAQIGTQQAGGIADPAPLMVIGSNAGTYTFWFGLDRFSLVPVASDASGLQPDRVALFSTTPGPNIAMTFRQFDRSQYPFL